MLLPASPPSVSTTRIHPPHRGCPVVEAGGTRAAALFEMIQDRLDVPFATMVLGISVTVIAVELTTRDGIVAVCRHGRDLLRISVLELPMPDPRPRGAEWIDAYRHWARPR